MQIPLDQKGKLLTNDPFPLLVQLNDSRSPGASVNLEISAVDSTEVSKMDSSNLESKEKDAVLANGLEVLEEGARPIDPRESKRVLRKIDLYLIPAMIVGICVFIPFPTSF